MITRFRLAIGAAVLGALLLLPAVAQAHAELDTVIPADKSTVEGPPVQVQMTFTEKLDPAKSSIKLVDATGAVVAEGSTVDTGSPTTMRLILPRDLPAGPYTARWVSASAEDGDLDRGTTSFTVVAAPSVAPSVAASDSPAPSAVASVAPSSAPTVAPSAAPTTPTSSTSDAIIPIVAVLVVLVLLGLWLLRGRTRTTR